MNLVEIYDYELEQLLEQEKWFRDQIETHESQLKTYTEEYKKVLKRKQELKEDLENNLRFWGKNASKN